MTKRAEKTRLGVMSPIHDCTHVPNRARYADGAHPSIDARAAKGKGVLPARVWSSSDGKCPGAAGLRTWTHREEGWVGAGRWFADKADAEAWARAAP